MLSIKLLKIGSEGYYLNLASEDYYLKGGEPPGRWIGGGCETLGLQGNVERETFRRLLHGYHPHAGGSPDDPPELRVALVQSAGKENHQAAWDFTFSAPKSISVIWSQATPKMRARIQELHFEAIQKTLLFIEKNFAFSRTGQGGTGPQVAVKLVAAVFEHGTSRAADPNLHSHVPVFNVGVDASTSQKLVTRTLVSNYFFQQKMLAGAIYRGYLAHLVDVEYGFQADLTKVAFEIRGVPSDLISVHSTRRKQVEADLIRKGRSGGEAAAKSALETRGPKHKSLVREKLFAKWQETNSRHGFNTQTVEDLVCPRVTNYEKFIPALLRLATKSISRSRTHFSRHDFLREVLRFAPQFGVSPDLLFAAVERHLFASKQIVPIPAQNRFTTKAILKREVALLEIVSQLRIQRGAAVSQEKLFKVFQKHPRLNFQQQAAVRHITQEGGAIRIVQGYAGVGKTTMLKAAVDAWQQAGHKVVGACFTGVAAQQLQTEIGIPCDTINMTLADFPKDWYRTAKWLMAKAVRRIEYEALRIRIQVKMQGRQRRRRRRRKKKAPASRKRLTFLGKPKSVAIDHKTVVLLDEAGMINTRHMQMVTEWVQKNNATLVLVGDSAQIPAIEGGSPLKSIASRVGYAEVTEIQRQREQWARDAAYYMAKGNIGPALTLYEQRKLVKVEEDVTQALTRLIDDWAQTAYNTPERARILALTNHQVQLANRLAQQKRIERKVLDPTKSCRITCIRPQTGETYISDVHVGDRVLFTKTNRTFRVVNGNAGTVTGFCKYKTPFRSAIKVKLDNGKTVTVPLNFKHIRLGYASTVHSTQGGTFPEVFVLLGGPSQNLPISYVQGTRSSLATHFYVERALYDEVNQDIEESPLVAQMSREVDLSLAADLFIPVLACSPERDKQIDQLFQHWREHARAYTGHSVVIVQDRAQAADINARASEIAVCQLDADEQHKRRRLAVDAAHSQSRPSEHKLPPLKELMPRGFATPIPERPPVGSSDVLRIDVRQRDGTILRIPVEQFAREAQLIAITVGEAPKLRCKVNNLYVLPQPIQQTQAAPYSLANEFQQSHVTSWPNVFGPTATPTSAFGIQADNTFVMTQLHAAAEHHQKLQQINQGTPWYSQQTHYSQSLTKSYSYEHSHHQSL